MQRTLLAVAVICAGPVWSQATNDDTPAIENWWDEVGADFFSEATMQEPRPDYEIRAQWTGLSADDQGAVLARCAALAGETVSAPSTQEGSEDNAPDTNAAELADSPETGLVDPATGAIDPAITSDEKTTTGSVNGVEVQEASPSDTPAPDTGLAGGTGDKTNMVLICDLIPEL